MPMEGIGLTLQFLRIYSFAFRILCEEKTARSRISLLCLEKSTPDLSQRSLIAQMSDMKRILGFFDREGEKRPKPSDNNHHRKQGKHEQ